MKFIYINKSIIYINNKNMTTYLCFEHKLPFKTHIDNNEELLNDMNDTEDMSIYDMEEKYSYTIEEICMIALNNKKYDFVKKKFLLNNIFYFIFAPINSLENIILHNEFLLKSKKVLHYAILRERLDLVTYLLNNMTKEQIISNIIKYIDIYVHSKEISLNNYNPLMLSCLIGNIDIFEILVAKYNEYEIPLNEFNETQFGKITPFYIACSIEKKCTNKDYIMNKIEIARRLYRYCEQSTYEDNIDVNIGDDIDDCGVGYEYPIPILIQVCDDGIFEMVKFLVEECHADVNKHIYDSYSGWYSALTYAMSNNYMDIVNYLLDNGDSWKNYYTGEMYFKIIRSLLLYGTNQMVDNYIKVNEIKDFNNCVIFGAKYTYNRGRLWKDNFKPLEFLAMHEKYNMIKHLLSISQNVQYDIYNCNFLSHATPNVIKWFIKEYNNINLKGHPEYKNLIFNICKHNLQHIKFFVEEFEIDINIYDDDGNNAIYNMILDTNFTHDDNIIENIKYFISKGLDINKYNKNGITPILKSLYINTSFIAKCTKDIYISKYIDIDNIDKKGTDIITYIISIVNENSSHNPYYQSYYNRTIDKCYMLYNLIKYNSDIGIKYYSQINNYINLQVHKSFNCNILIEEMKKLSKFISV